MAAGIYWILRQGHQRRRNRLIYQGFLLKAPACTMECPCLVYPPFHLGGTWCKSIQPTSQPTNQPSHPFPKSGIAYMLGVINPSYEMRLYTVRIRDSAARAGNYFWQRGQSFICASDNGLFPADVKRECFWFPSRRCTEMHPRWSALKSRPTCVYKVMWKRQ